jgi:hypothetical protein
MVLEYAKMVRPFVAFGQAGVSQNVVCLGLFLDLYVNWKTFFCFGKTPQFVHFSKCKQGQRHLRNEPSFLLGLSFLTLYLFLSLSLSLSSALPDDSLISDWIGCFWAVAGINDATTGPLCKDNNFAETKTFLG